MIKKSNLVVCFSLTYFVLSTPSIADCWVADKDLLEEYSGGCVEGKAHGYGIASSNRATYEGNFRNGMKHGFGTKTIRKYVEFVANGKEYYLGGQVYSGNWKEDLLHGKGKVVEPDGGGSYEGVWKKGKKHGYGLEVVGESKRYEGQWKDDKPYGEGKHKWDGRVFIGFFDNYHHLKKGNGKIIYPDGKIYEGEVYGTAPLGKGKFIYPNGVVFTGSWPYGGVEEGSGIVTWPNGDTYKDIWETGVPRGNGILQFVDGTSVKGALDYSRNRTKWITEARRKKYEAIYKKKSNTEKNTAILALSAVAVGYGLYKLFSWEPEFSNTNYKHALNSSYTPASATKINSSSSIQHSAHVTSIARDGKYTLVKCSIGKNTKVYHDDYGKCSDNYQFGSYGCTSVLKWAQERCENR